MLGPTPMVGRWSFIFPAGSWVITPRTMASLLLILLPILLFFPTNSADSPFPSGSLPTSSGYLSIAPNSTSALFFAFYEAKHHTTPFSSTPLLVWLHGGTGCSSLQANFFEIGPYLLSHNHPTLHPNPSSWNRRFGLIFIDNPLGAGFSTDPSNADIPRDQPTVTRHLFAALQSFLSSNPSFRTRPLFLTGSSYAGKYISTAGYHILQNNPHLPVSDRINLAGVAIGNGLIHPIVQIINADVAYYAGLINGRQRTHLESLQYEAVRLIVDGERSAANDAAFAAWSWLQNATGLATLGDVTRLTADNYTMVGVFLNKEEVKEALGVRNKVAWEECNEAVSRALQNESMKSAKFELEYLAENSRVLVYQGIYDLLGGVVSTEAWIKEMEWEGLESFMAAERIIWKKDGLRAGYVQRWGRFSQVVVSGAGHSAAADQKRNTQAMIEDWVLERGLFVNSFDGYSPSIRVF